MIFAKDLRDGTKGKDYRDSTELLVWDKVPATAIVGHATFSELREKRRAELKLRDDTDYDLELPKLKRKKGRTQCRLPPPPLKRPVRLRWV